MRARLGRILALTSCLLATWLMVLALALPAAAQAPRVAAVSAPTGPFRTLAPGVEITIAPDRQEKDTFATHDIVEILRGIPNLEWAPQQSPETQTLKEMATDTVFRRDIWCLEFTFKPVRMIRVDGRLVWYMVYHVRNTGGHQRPIRQEDGSFTIEPFDKDVRFFPTFTLESHEYKKAYLDVIIPGAIPLIQAKEDPNRPLANSVEVGSRLVTKSTELVDNSVWGVATWVDIDSRVDTFSVYVAGLTNAYQWIDPPGAFNRGDPPGKGRVLLEKNLMLNFWRPGDEYVEDQRIIRYGIPGKVDYSWVFR